MIKSENIRAAAKTIASQIEAANLTDLYKEYLDAENTEGVKRIINLVAKTMDDKAQIAREAIGGSLGDQLRMNDAIIENMEQ